MSYLASRLTLTFSAEEITIRLPNDPLGIELLKGGFGVWLSDARAISNGY